MQNQLFLNQIPVDIRHNKRAKRIIIKIRHGGVELVIPRRSSLKTAVKFLHSKQAWIEDRLSKQKQKITLEIGGTYPVLGNEHEVVYAGLRGKAELVDNKIIITGDEKLAAKKIKKLLREYLKQELSQIAEAKAKEIGVKYSSITLRDNTTRWGSCSAKGNLNFSWRLVFAPYEVMQYLVCHELAHIKEMNHGKKFWDLVEQLDPNYERSELWLKKNGNTLHLYE